ncbi:ATP-binding cassette domain-containing protein [Caloranaerobacter sp. DY30410]|uniref:ATP-binding cassette domain-containing protein n=1 Tax=Caloranaerobacter sp. DY30410 TaxID=3238305 RepID=UPI003D006401
MIKIKNLTYKYKNHIAIDDLSLEINKGMIGLLGENGAGKTTLMKLMVTLQSIQQGEIIINDIEIKNKNYHKIRKIVGFMPQEFGFYGSFTVYEMLEYICLLENMKKKDIDGKIKELLEELSLTRQMYRKTKELSGGMKRRLGLACAMINEPEILIVDEPTVGLDPEERIKMRNLIKRYSVGRTVILSTHIVEDIKSICDEVIVLSKGKLLYSGNINDLIESSPDVYEVECKVEDIDNFREYGTITDINHNHDSCTIKVVTTNPNFKYIKKVDKTLETAYMYLLKREMVSSSYE